MTTTTKEKQDEARTNLAVLVGMAAWIALMVWAGMVYGKTAAIAILFFPFVVLLGGACLLCLFCTIVTAFFAKVEEDEEEHQDRTTQDAG